MMVKFECKVKLKVESQCITNTDTDFRGQFERNQAYTMQNHSHLFAHSVLKSTLTEPPQTTQCTKKASFRQKKLGPFIHQRWRTDKSAVAPVAQKKLVGNTADLLRHPRLLTFAAGGQFTQRDHDLEECMSGRGRRHRGGEAGQVSEAGWERTCLVVWSSSLFGTVCRLRKEGCHKTETQT